MLRLVCCLAALPAAVTFGKVPSPAAGATEDELSLATENTGGQCTAGGASCTACQVATTPSACPSETTISMEECCAFAQRLNTSFVDGYKGGSNAGKYGAFVVSEATLPHGCQWYASSDTTTSAWFRVLYNNYQNNDGRINAADADLTLGDGTSAGVPAVFWSKASYSLPVCTAVTTTAAPITAAPATFCANTCPPVWDCDAVYGGFYGGQLCDSAGPSLASDGECDDGGPGSDWSVCEFGHDCTDCGSRSCTDITTASQREWAKGVGACLA